MALEVTDRSLPPLEVCAIDDDDPSIDGELITEDELADEVGAEWHEDDPVVKRLFDDLIRGEQAKAVLAEAEMRRVIEFNQSVDHRFQEGLGQLVARIPLSVYLHWSAVYGHEFWDQPDSLDFLAKRAGGGRGNPGLLIQTSGKATVIVDQAFAGVAAKQSPAEEAGVCGKTPAGGCTDMRPPAGRSRVRGKRGRWAK